MNYALGILAGMGIAVVAIALVSIFRSWRSWRIQHPRISSQDRACLTLDRISESLTAILARMENIEEGTDPTAMLHAIDANLSNAATYLRTINESMNSEVTERYETELIGHTKTIAILLNSISNRLTSEAIGAHVSNMDRIKERLEDANEGIRAAVTAVSDRMDRIEKHLEALVMVMGTLTDQQRNLLRQMTGSGGDGEDELVEQALNYRRVHPELTLEEAIYRVRQAKVYSRG